MQTDSSTLRRAEIRRIFDRNRGAAAQLARDLVINPASISQWMKGRIDSKRIADAARIKALDLLAEEKSRAGSAA